MLEYNKQRQLIITCVIAIILTIVFSVIYIIKIWMPEPQKENVFEVGIVDYDDFEDEDILLKYYEKISKLLMNSELDEICTLVGEDYLEYFGYTLDDVKSYIQEKKIMGKTLRLTNSVKYLIDGYSNVFYLDINAVGEVYSIGIIIRELSPEQFTISFDKFIDYRENVYNGDISSIGLQVLKVARYTTNVEYRLRITNNYDKAIVLNANKEANGIVMVSKVSGALKKPIMLSLANRSEIIETGQSKEYSVNYYIAGDTDYMLYNVFVLKGVSYTGIVGTNDLEFYLN